MKIVVGLSGGVDSSVSAALLKQQGHEVIGMFMKNWDEPDATGVCQSAEDFKVVQAICQQLDIPYYAIDFIDEYQDRVFHDFLEDLKMGFTPNPDILCNREIKFDVFFKQARKLGADYLATGHYCQTNESGHLIKGVDPTKDQSYFLCAVKSSVLKSCKFPIGEIHKSDVRKIAASLNLSNAKRKDSTGICFIGERKMREFLSKYIPEQKGLIKDIHSKKTLSEHDGLHHYTLGQRRGLKLGGEGLPWFVIQKDTATKTLWVSRGEHELLFSKKIKAVQFHWIDQELSAGFRFTQLKDKKLTAKIRYRQQDQACSIQTLTEDQIEVLFETPQRAATPGQYLVLYDQERCMGGGRIVAAGN